MTEMQSSTLTSTNPGLFCFVVLHYKTIDETMKCVASIEEVIDYPAYHIIVVDNGSCDGTGERLLTTYAEDPLVTVLQNPSNLGFARGNNVGFRYAKERLGSMFICLLNSDIVITQPDMCERALASMDQTGSVVMGPLIVNPDGSHLGPHTFPGLAFLKPDTWDMKVSLWLAEHGLELPLLITAFRAVHTVLVRGYRAQRPIPLDAESPHDNVVLEGCCLFFSPDYVRRFDGLDERTFLYHEEDLLHLRLQDCGMTSSYDPSLSVFHNHHATTRSLAGDALAHKVFRYRHQLESRAILLHELEARR